MKRIIYAALIFLLLTVAVAVFFSPYKYHDGYEYRLIRNSIELEAAPSEVFNYLGNSSTVKDWSVFVDHIEVLNSDSVSDGSPGCRRRCFKQEDEKGITWDETIMAVSANRLRLLSIYNMQHFPIDAEGLVTEQVYDSIGPGRTRLSFLLYFKDKEPEFSEKFKTFIAGWRIRQIFRQNLNNIKQRVESKN